LKLLVSYAYMTPTMLRVVQDSSEHVRWLLDSGAFTANEQGKTISLNEYADFIQEHGHHFWQAISLDKICDGVVTDQNYQYMKLRGLSPMPVITTDMHVDRVNEYVAGGATHFCVAGGVTWPSEKYGPRLTAIRERAGPDVWLHGLGFTRGMQVARTAINSVDSSTWLSGKRWGQLQWFEAAKGVKNTDWKTVRRSKWVNLPRVVQETIMGMALTNADMGSREVSTGCYSAIAMQSVHANLRYAEALESCGVHHYFATTNPHDTEQFLIAVAHCTRKGAPWPPCKVDVDRLRRKEVGVKALAEAAAAQAEKTWRLA